MRLYSDWIQMFPYSLYCSIMVCNTARTSHLVSSEYCCNVSNKLQSLRQTDSCSREYRLAEDCGQSRTFYCCSGVDLLDKVIVEGETSSQLTVRIAMKREDSVCWLCIKLSRIGLEQEKERERRSSFHNCQYLLLLVEMRGAEAQIEQRNAAQSQVSQRGVSNEDRKSGTSDRVLQVWIATLSKTAEIRPTNHTAWQVCWAR
jgi:hypothetical protein